MKAVVDSYTVRHDPAWDVFGDAYNGDIRIARQGAADEDKWSISLRGDSDRLHRKALKWREKHPDAPLYLPEDHRADGRKFHVFRMLDPASMPSSRSDAWKRNHQFTLAEALYVAGATL